MENAVRYSLTLVLTLAPVAWPAGAGAQVSEQDATSRPNLDTESKEPSLQLEVDDSALAIVPGPSRKAEEEALREAERSVKRARIGIIVSSIGLVAGGLMILGANTKCTIGEWTESCNRTQNAGIAVMSAGGVAMIVTGGMLGVRRRELRKLERKHYRLPSQVR